MKTTFLRRFFNKILSPIGINVAPEKGQPVIITRRFLMFLLIVGAVFIVFSIGLTAYSTSPSFCQSCHIMKPYYDAWKTSRHNKVPCVKCHYPPGTPGETLWLKFQATAQVVKFVTRTYSSKPYAEIEDRACLRSGCHSQRLLEGKVVFQGTGNVQFDHAPHLQQVRRGKKLRCTSCHSQIVIGTHVEVTTSTCYLCHFKGKRTEREENPIAGCTSCHRTPDKEIVYQGITYNHREFVGKHAPKCDQCHIDIVQGEGNAPKDRCFNCHNQPEKLAKYDDIDYMHEQHVAEHNVACIRCHEEIRHEKTTTLTSTIFSCNACHTSKHDTIKNMFTGVGGKNFPSLPSHMFSFQVDCVACHIQPVAGHVEQEKTYMASSKACLKCHEKNYVDMLLTWKGLFKNMLEGMNRKLKFAKSALDDAPWGGTEELRNKLSDARYNTDFVMNGHGPHNPLYAAALLHGANNSLEFLANGLGVQLPETPADEMLEGKYCMKLCHMDAGVKTPKTVIFDNRDVPHIRHINSFGISCTSCHIESEHTEVVATKQICFDCHHSIPDRECTECHEKNLEYFNGKTGLIKDGTEEPSNPMSGESECEDCHLPGNMVDTKELANQCVECHDESYRATFAGWEKDIEDKLNSVEEKIAELKEKGAHGKTLHDSKNMIKQIRSGPPLHNPELTLKLLKGIEDKFPE
jgi:nitrate/TMAO reductase-like tetraheme cytochrome c subunit